MTFPGPGETFAPKTLKSMIESEARWTEDVREGRYPNRSRALRYAVDLIAAREKRNRLARELNNSTVPKKSALPMRIREMNPGQHTEGEIYWAALNPVRGREPAGMRPVLILSNNLFNRRSGTVIAMAITSQPQTRRISSDIRIAAGLPAARLMGENL